MNKELIELQKNCNATCVVIPEDKYQELGQAVIMDANISDEYLLARPYFNPIFKDKLDYISSSGNLTYFIIKRIDKLTEEMQNRYVGLVKDREFGGYHLPQNVIIVFTVKDREGLQKISKELYHFCVVAF